MRRVRLGATVVPIAAACALALSACGDSKSGGDSATAAGSSAGGSSSGDFTASSLQKAKAGVAPFLGHPSPIPVTEPLAKQPPPGSTIVFVSCASPECQQFVPGLQSAADALGVKFKTITAGTSAQGVNSAFASAAQLKPLAVIDPALDPSLWRQAAKTLKAQGTPVVGHSVVEPPGNNFAATVLGAPALQKWARIQADYVYTKSGNKTKAVYLNTPEFAVFGAMGTSFKQELSSLCSACAPDILNIPAAELGAKAPARIVSYLQAHPDVNWVVTSAPSQVFGLPPALKAAGISDVKLMSDGGLSKNYEYIKAGQAEADISVDYIQDTWQMVDAAARVGTGQKISDAAQGAAPSQQILEQKDITFDTSKPWLALPDYQDQYKKLWGKQ
jgi:ribose transport system substrate-binding protein